MNRRGSTTNDSRQGFTLVELTAVMVVLSILIGALAFSLRGNLENANLQDLLDRIQTLDGRTRDEARRTDHFLIIEFDANQGQITRSASNVQSLGNRSSRTIHLARGLSIDRIRTGKSESEQGTLRVAVSPLGQSDTYAVRLSTKQGRKVWLVIIGMTGQILRLEKDRDVDQVFALQTS